MSNHVLPDLPIGRKVTREPYANVIINESASGQEARSSWWFGPRNRLTLSFDVLRTAQAELDDLMGFFAAHFYTMDSFLIQPTDETVVVNHGFGVGDGTTLSFQLQRSRVATVYDKTGGPWTVKTTPTKNWLLGSSDPTKWTLTSLTSTTCLAPDSTWTAHRLTASGSTPNLTQTASGLVATTHTFSVWLRSADVTSVTINGTATTITTRWARYHVAATPTAGSIACSVGVATGHTVEMWGAQLEVGTTATLYVPTLTAVATRTPAYFPNYTDGFEPVYEAGNDVTVMVDGTVISSNGSLGPYGVWTFDAGHAPASGTVLTWSGSWYLRVRLEEQGLPFDRIVDGAYKTGTVKLIEVKP
jgi:hypothetical protein